MEAKRTKIIWMILIFLSFIVLYGCNTMTQEERAQREAQILNRWNSQVPTGFKNQLEVADLTEQAYHAIVDTPIKELQTEAGAQRIGDLVTAARDKYRQWQSYGNYHVPRAPAAICIPKGQGVWELRVKFGSIGYNSGHPGFEGSVLEFIFDFGDDKSFPSELGAILSSRGRPIFAGRYNDERNWQPVPPFKHIMEGDRIADIPSLIGRIKR